MSAVYTNPPSEWAGAVQLTDDTYYLAPDPLTDTVDLIVWHWCKPVERWEGASCSAHTLHNGDLARLHVEPSLACARNGEGGCAWHIWIRDGKVERA